MMHDPFQSYSTLGANPGITGALGLNPLGFGQLGGFSPFGQQFGQQQGMGQGGIHPQQLQQQLQHQLQQQLLQHQLQQLQLATLLAQTNPHVLGLSQFAGGWHNPIASIGLQNPVLSQILQNPYASQILQNPLVSQQLLNPLAAQYYPQQYPQIGLGGQSPFGQIGSPYGQIGSPFGQSLHSLAPQSWIGQQGLGGWGRGF